MPSASVAVAEIVGSDPLLTFGLHHRLLNLTQVARFIQPLVEARAGKPVKSSAILMGLSRRQKEMAAQDASADTFQIGRISVQSGLLAITFPKTPETHEQLTRLLAHVLKEKGYMTLTEGSAEITAIVSNDAFSAARKTLSAAPRRVQRNLAGLGIQISDNDYQRPGLLYTILQQIALQGISVVEVASTTSEFHVYLREDDVRLAFDSVYNRFLKR